MRIILLILLLNPTILFADEYFEDKAESVLIQSLNHAAKQDWQTAESYANQLRQQYPQFRSATILQTLINNKTLPVQLAPPLIKPWTNEYTTPNLIAELNLRWAASKRNLDLNKKPASIIKLNLDTQHIIVVETNSSRAFLFKNKQGQPEYIGDFYIAIGKLGIGKDKQGKQKEGDHLTPIGIYNINAYLPDKKLQEIYGVGALTLNYPNALDKHLNKTGNGIWLHGVPRDTYSRPPNSSRGCITMNNAIFTQLHSYINIKTTPVIITDNIQWIDKNTNHDIASSLNKWKTSWESRNLEQYFNNYDSDFKGSALKKWQQQKKRISQGKSYIKVDIKKLNIYQYPKKQNIYITEFEQHYQSNNYNGISNKQLYWKKYNGGIYKIILEKIL